MKGNVLGFDPDSNCGAISGFDGNRYDFVTLDWRGASRPRKGDLVDFQAIDRHATEIYLLEPRYVAPTVGQFYFSPNGRISRSQYWLRFVLPYFVISFLLQLVAGIAGDKTPMGSIISFLGTIFWLVAFWPSIAILVKRIHDRGKTGWTCLWIHVPATLGTILLIAWLASGFHATGAGDVATFALPPLGVLGGVVIALGVATAAVGIWFFIEFGCLRGTVGANRFGPDPVQFQAL